MPDRKNNSREREAGASDLAPTSNDYLREVLDLAGGNDQALRDGIFLGPKLRELMSDKRKRLVLRYAWAIPSTEALNMVAKFAPIVELGAGGGYWASLLSATGAGIVAFDRAVTAGNPGIDARVAKRWFDVRPGDEAVLSGYSDRSLLLCWPPYDTSMAVDALKAFSGEVVIYVGEDIGGCNATDDFFNALDSGFDVIETVNIPTWPGLHDSLTVFKRKRPAHF